MELITNETQEIIPNESVKTYKMIALRGVVVFPGQSAYCDIGRDKSIVALNKAVENKEEIFLVLQKHANAANPAPKDIFRIGTLAKIVKVAKMPNSSIRLYFEGIKRMEIVNYVSRIPHFEVTLTDVPLLLSEPIQLEAVKRNVLAQLEEYKKLDTRLAIGVDANFSISNVSAFCAVIGSKIYKKEADKQRLLQQPDEYSMLEDVYSYLAKEAEILAVEKKIAAKVRESIDKNQKEYHLREQVKAIHEELGEGEDELIAYRERAEKKKLPKYVMEKVSKEISKMERMSPTSPESGVSRTYIEWMLDMPWNEKTKENSDLKKAKQILDEDHYGLEKVKERIVEYLAVTHLTKEFKAPILCFVGPPGVGKTSIVSSIARASGRKFISMSLGGVRDEAEVRGHRRTYIGALPGRIINGIKQAGASNPVFLLDEIDKMSSDFRGDPASAMLEVLDPNQNAEFKDHYIEIPYDLSKVMFVTTANTLDTIPSPLLDRMEIIELSGYTYEEKLQIAKKYLLPKQIKANGLSESMICVPDEALKVIIANYTRESGVRKLEQQVAKVCRKVAVKFVNKEFDGMYTVSIDDMESFLGTERYSDDVMNGDDEAGVATGLAWTSVGGVTLPLEVSLIPDGKGEITLTGSLGDVMKESCQIALSLVKSRAKEYNISPEIFKTNDIHIHFPEGATPKDGPSAGITISTALLSAFSGRKVSRFVAMTGEVTLRGKVLAIGGLKEKSLAAYRHGIKKLIIPQENKKDVADLPSEVTDSLEIVFADKIDTVFDNAIV